MKAGFVNLNLAVCRLWRGESGIYFYTHPRSGFPTEARFKQPPAASVRRGAGLRKKEVFAGCAYPRRRLSRTTAASAMSPSPVASQPPPPLLLVGPSCEPAPLALTVTSIDTLLKPVSYQ